MKMNFRRGFAVLLSAAMLAGVATSCGGGGGGTSDTPGGGDAKPGKTYSLSFTIHDPATSAKTAYYEELAAATKEATDGAVDITIYPGGTLVAAADVAEGVLTGAADIGWLYTAFFAGQFPLTEVACLPMFFDDSMQATNVLNDMFEQSTDLQAELDGYKVLGMYCNPSNYIYTKGKAVNAPADLRGLNLRAPAGVGTDMITAWGGTPIAMGPGDVYESINKGVIDGYVLEWTGTKSFNLGEVIDYCTEVPMFCGVFLTVMNKDKWNELPAEYQSVMDEIWCRDASLGLAQLNLDDGNLGRETAINEQDVTIITPDDAAMAEFQSAADTYVANWITNMTTADFDAQEYIDLATSLKENY